MDMKVSNVKMSVWLFKGSLTLIYRWHLTCAWRGLRAVASEDKAWRSRHHPAWQFLLVQLLYLILLQYSVYHILGPTLRSISIIVTSHRPFTFLCIPANIWTWKQLRRALQPEIVLEVSGNRRKPHCNAIYVHRHSKLCLSGRVIADSGLQRMPWTPWISSPILPSTSRYRIWSTRRRAMRMGSGGLDLPRTDAWQTSRSCSRHSQLYQQPEPQCLTAGSNGMDFEAAAKGDC